MNERITTKRPSNLLYLITLLAFVLGLALGFLTPGIFKPIAFIGDVYINLLKLIVIPLLMTEVTIGVYAASQSVGGRIARTIGMFIVMFTLSFLITAAMMALLKPGYGVVLPGSEEAYSGELAAMTLGDFFKSILPANIVSAMASGSILPCILFAFVCGIAAAAVKAEHAMKVTEDLRRIFNKVLSYIMYVTPLGVFALIGNAMATYGAALLGLCAKYILIAWLGCAVVSLLVLILPVWIFARINPITYVRRVARIWLITLSTCSSAATLPHTIRVCNEAFGVPAHITGVVVPLGCTIHMCGGAVSFCILGMFSMQLVNTPVTLGMFLYMLLIATLMNMAAPGIPGGGIVLGATYLSILGVPTYFIGMYSGIYRLLDMAYTSVNVTGDISANILLAKWEASHPAAQPLDAARAAGEGSGENVERQAAQQ